MFRLKFLIPSVQDIHSVAQMHPDVTDTSRQASQEDVIPEVVVGCGEAKNAGYDTQPVEDGIPIAKSD